MPMIWDGSFAFAGSERGEGEPRAPDFAKSSVITPETPPASPFVAVKTTGSVISKAVAARFDAIEAIYNHIAWTVIDLFVDIAFAPVDTVFHAIKAITPRAGIRGCGDGHCRKRGHQRCTH